MRFIKTVFWWLFSILFPATWKRIVRRDRRAIFRLLFRLCHKDYERYTCRQLKQQMLSFDRQMQSDNIHGCIFAVNVMLGLRDRITDNEYLALCIHRVCEMHIAHLLRAGVDPGLIKS